MRSADRAVFEMYRLLKTQQVRKLGGLLYQERAPRTQ
jgi:hypothetical protein